MGKTLITGVAGFIGFHLASRLLKDNVEVLGIDNLNAYYDVNLKKSRLLHFEGINNFEFKKIDLSNKEEVEQLFVNYEIDYVINLAAQPGVRYSLENPQAYIDSNIIGFFNLLEAIRNHPVKHLVFASSSSVYGANEKLPYSVKDNVDYPISLYAATKKSNELMAHCYSHLYQIPVTGLRFFTVYGPWGRPDMAMFSFTRDIIEGKTIKLFNYGDHYRDFTYIDDIIEGMVRVIPYIPAKIKTGAFYNIFNIGNQTPVQLLDYIGILEKHLGVKAKTELVPPQMGDVKDTHADIESLIKAVDYQPQISIDEGVKRFVKWYREYSKS